MKDVSGDTQGIISRPSESNRTASSYGKPLCRIVACDCRFGSIYSEDHAGRVINKILNQKHIQTITSDSISALI